MKNTAFAITFVALAGTLTLPAETLANGIRFETPAGWRANVVGEAAALFPPNHAEQAELYGIARLEGVRDGNDPQAGAVLSSKLTGEGYAARPVGQPIVFQAAGGTGRVFAFDVAKDGERGRILFFVVGLKGGATALVAAGKTELLAARQSGLAEIAASLGGQVAAPLTAAAAPATAIARQWQQRLSDKKLVYMSSYNSGYGGGGYSSEKKLYLASDGSYAFRSASSVSVYVPGATGGSAGRDAQQGRWRIVEQNGQAHLELVAANGSKELLRLSADGSKTFLNGTRWFVVGINE